MRCEVCGNEYDKVFQVRMAGKTHLFDSFECAIHALAPHCSHCGCRVLGHGLEAEGKTFCCASCARYAGYEFLRDRYEPRFGPVGERDRVEQASWESFPASDSPAY